MLHVSGIFPIVSELFVLSVKLILLKYYISHAAANQRSTIKAVLKCAGCYSPSNSSFAFFFFFAYLQFPIFPRKFSTTL